MQVFVIAVGAIIATGISTVWATKLADYKIEELRSDFEARFKAQLHFNTETTAAVHVLQLQGARQDLLNETEARLLERIRSQTDDRYTAGQADKDLKAVGDRIATLEASVQAMREYIVAARRKESAKDN